MREMINRMQNILEQMKGFTLDEIENPNEDIFKDLDSYLK